MGYFYNHLEERWDPIDHERKLTRGQKRRIQRRGELIADLITEIERGKGSVTKLYAGLLARTLASTDEILLREYGQRLAEMTTPPQPKPVPAARVK